MQKYDVAAYIWPAYTGDEPRTRMFWPEGMGEWQSVRSATAKFDGHTWPRKPLWGYVNEANPAVMEMEINEAVNHGVNVFIYDWYWYDDRPYLENCLNDGFLKASNRDKMKFYLMWANHDANGLWNKELSDTREGSTVIWSGQADEIRFRHVIDRVISKYFSEPNYYKIDGKPVFMIYDFRNLVSGLGGAENTKKALELFREETVKAGFPGLHLQLVAWGRHNVNWSGFDASGNSAECDFESIGFDSITNYQFAHYANIDRDYREILKDVKSEYDRIDAEYHVPYFPHISAGWDNNPRFKKFRPGIVKNNTPEAFKEGLLLAKEYVDTHNLPAPLITINSWNEWTETSYLEPDDLYGYGYLDAIREVFCE